MGTRQLLRATLVTRLGHRGCLASPNCTAYQKMPNLPDLFLKGCGYWPVLTGRGLREIWRDQFEVARIYSFVMLAFTPIPGVNQGGDYEG
jgi:hypothetical protein